MILKKMLELKEENETLNEMVRRYELILGEIQDLSSQNDYNNPKMLNRQIFNLAKTKIDEPNKLWEKME